MFCSVACGRALQIFAAGVNPVETYIRSGIYDDLPSLPWTPGNDGAGVIRQLGGGVAASYPRLAVGDRVWVAKSATGTYAQFAVARAGDVAPLPAALSFEQGAAISVAFRTAYKALVLRGGLRAGQSVLVHGASGGVGMAAVQLARLYGASVVFGTAGTRKGRDVLEEMGGADKARSVGRSVGPSVRRSLRVGSLARSLARARARLLWLWLFVAVAVCGCGCLLGGTHARTARDAMISVGGPFVLGDAL